MEIDPNAKIEVLLCGCRAVSGIVTTRARGCGKHRLKPELRKKSYPNLQNRLPGFPEPPKKQRGA